MKRLHVLLLAVLAVLPVHAQRPLTVSELVADPARYNHQIVEIRAFVSHGFEDFTLVDLDNEHGPRVWVEYGGTAGSNTIYCCNVPAERRRDAPLRVEGIETRMVEDRQFRTFDRLLQSNPEVILHATLRGRFFAGEEAELPGGKRWTGYGHFGLFSLFVIEQVVSIDHTDLRDVDYDVAGAAPPGDGEDCFPSAPRAAFASAIELQRRADAGQRTWSFTDPARVAAAQLADEAGRPVRIIRTLERSRGRVVYEVAGVHPPGTSWATVSRPYWLSFFAAGRRRVAWTLLGASPTECAE